MIAVASLAQTSYEQAVQQILWAAGFLLIALLVSVAVGLLVRRMLFSTPERHDTAGFTLEQMRRMYEAGELSEQEWQTMRAALLARTRHALADEADEAEEAPSSAPTTNGISPGADIRSTGANNQSNPEDDADEDEPGGTGDAPSTSPPRGAS